MAHRGAAARCGRPAGRATLLGFGMQWALTSIEGGSGSFFAGYAAEGPLSALSAWGPTILPALSIPTFLAVMLLDRRIAPLSRSAALRRAAGIGGAAGVLLLFLAPRLGPASLPACAFGCLLAGACPSLLLVMWSEVYSALPGRSIAVWVGLSICLGAVASLACGLAPAWASAAAGATLSLASASLIPQAAEESKLASSWGRASSPRAGAPGAEASPPPSRTRGPFIRLLLGLAVFGVAFELFPALLADGAGGSSATALGRSLALLFDAATGLAVAAVSRCAASVSTRRLFRLVLPVTAAALLMASLLGKATGPWAYAVMSAGETILDVVIWMALADTASRTGRSAAFVYSSGRLAAHIGRTAGSMAGGAAVASLGGAGSAALVTACCAMMYALVLTSSFMMGGEDVGGEGAAGANGEVGATGPARPAPSLESSCRALAAENGLSPRELQILVLLARGRSVPFIQQELHIAESTAKTHTHRVYEKLGVHTKQELLDLIESRNGGAAKRP